MQKMNRTRWKHPFLPIIFSLLGVLLTGYGIGISDLKTIIMGVFTSLAFLSPVLHTTPGFVRLEIPHRLCIFAVGILGYYVFSLTLWGTITLLVSVVALADATRLIITKKTRKSL